MLFKRKIDNIMLFYMITSSLLFSATPIFANTDDDTRLTSEIKDGNLVHHFKVPDDAIVKMNPPKDGIVDIVVTLSNEDSSSTDSNNDRNGDGGQLDDVEESAEECLNLIKERRNQNDLPPLTVEELEDRCNIDQEIRDIEENNETLEECKEVIKNTRQERDLPVLSDEELENRCTEN